MLKAFWKKWTIDKPAILGDWLWHIFVVQGAAFLDRLTFRKMIAFVPLIILIIAYHHRIPLPPELVFLGDVLAYIDIFSVLLLLGMLSRAATILVVIKQAAARVGALASHLSGEARRHDFRHRRAGGGKGRKRPARRSKKDDDEPFVVRGFAWA